MNATWKKIDLKIFGEHYEVSSAGDVRNIFSGKILRQSIRNGYKAIGLYNGKINKSKTMNVHQLVANAFLEKRESQDQQKMIVNHKNGDKLDNRRENLEFVTYKENTKHALDMKLIVPHTKKVKQYDMNYNLIAIYDSILDASGKTGANDRHISAVCKGKRKTAGGFLWEYEDNINPIVANCDGKIITNFKNYKATSDGKIYSIRSKKYLVPKTLPSGYTSVKLCNNGKMKDVYIHRIVADLFIENPENKQWVNHKDSNKSNNHKDNLEWVTASENMIHSCCMLKKNKKNNSF